MLSRIATQVNFAKNKKIFKAIINVVQQRNSSSEPKIIRSKCPDVIIPDVSVDEYIFQGLDKWPNNIAVECALTGRNYSYIELYKRSRALANFLHKHPSLTQGDTIAVVLPNVPEFPLILLGAAQAGLKVTTVNPMYTPDEIAKQLRDSGTKMIFTLTELCPMVQKATSSLLDTDIPVVTIAHEQNQAPSKTIRFKDTIAGDHNLSFRISRSPDDVFILPYSSGTTGLPKGVELTTRNIVANLAINNAPEYSELIKEGEVTPVVLPMFHIFGLTLATLNPLTKGCKLVTIPKFDPQLFINVLQVHQPTFSFLVPPLVLLMTNHPLIKPEYIKRMRTIFSGAAPLGATDIERLHEKGGAEVNILQGYGLTETSCIVCTQTTALPNGVKLGGAGFCLRNTECKIVSMEDGEKTLGPNQSGELIVRGPQVMKGYHNNPQATKDVLDSNGWLKTGDVVHYDEDEHLFITDRLKEMIKVKGFQVAPAELEELLRDHPDIQEAAVIGVPHAAFGEVPKAFVVPKKGTTVNQKSVQEFVESKAAKHKHLVGGVVTIQSIPRNASGKILRKNLVGL